MKKNTNYILFAILIAICTGLFFYIRSGKQRIYYVDLQKLYAEFELKKELETSLANYTHKSTLELDSLGLAINQIKYRMDEVKTERDVMLYDQLANVYLLKEESYEKERSQLAQQFDDQIWKQLNQYIKDYAVDNDCDFVIGGNGDGSVMYARSSKDITEEMIKYANQHYNGK